MEQFMDLGDRLVPSKQIQLDYFPTVVWPVDEQETIRQFKHNERQLYIYTTTGALPDSAMTVQSDS